MITIEVARKVEPNLAGLSDVEVQEIIDGLYSLGNMAFEHWSSKKAEGSLTPKPNEI